MKRVSARLLCKLLRVTSLALCLLLVLCLDGTVSHADTQVTINQIRYSLDTSGLTAEVMGGKPVNGSLTIPGIIQYNGQTYRVTSIAAKAFADQYLGAKLSLAEGLLSIGESAFAGCMALKGDITIPDSVISMGESAFDGAYVSSAYVLTLGKGLTALPRKAFANIWGWGIKGIIFRGTQYSDIAADAFSGSDFYETTVPVTVHGAYGSMDALLAGALTNGFSVTYLDPDAKNAAWLQAQIDAAPDGVETTIALSANVLAEQTIVVPGGKNIRLVNQDGTGTIAAAKTLNVLFLVENGAVLALDGTDDTALRLLGSEVSKSFTGNLLTVEKGASVYLKHATLSGSKRITAQEAAAVFVNGYFNMSGGVIENCQSNTVLGGTVTVRAGAKMDMTGGTIRNNQNLAPNGGGGGILVYAWSEADKNAELNISGDALITGNIAAMQGGGVCGIGNVSINMSGGKIIGNESDGTGTKNGYGGGLSISVAMNDSQIFASDAKFHMTGGEISKNKANKSGGGVYINTSGAVLEGGRISDNTAGGRGGGIYVSVKPYTARLYNVLVTENTAYTMGGGIWLCPTGSLETYVTNGGAIFENATRDRDGAGDDLAFVSGEGKLTLADRMLGGGACFWYRDGGVYNNNPAYISSTGKVDSSIPRFDPANPVGPYTAIEHGAENYALKSMPEKNAKTLAEREAKLIISGNAAGFGGGIGSNGGVIIGTQEEYVVNVQKIWDEKTPEDSQKELTIYLMIDGLALEPMKLNQGNGWKASYCRLPKPEGRIRYSVAEDPVPEGFAPEYREEPLQDGILNVTILNHYRPGSGEDIPPTGDDTPLGLALFLFVISASGLALSFASRRRGSKQN